MALISEELASLPYVERYENSDLISCYMPAIHINLQSNQSYQIYHSFPEFPGGNYGDEFQDVRGPDGFTILSTHWIIIWRV